MKFYELKRGANFRFVDRREGDESTYYSRGIDGAYGRYVQSLDEMDDPARWSYCRPLDDVEVVE